MKKTLKISLIILVIALIPFIITGCKFGGPKEEKEEEGSKTYANLSKTLLSDNYVLTMEENGGKITIAVKGGNSCYEMEDDTGKQTIMFKDGISYIIYHADKQYMAVPTDGEDLGLNDFEAFPKEELEKTKTLECTKGKETIEGKEYEYEEFKDEDAGVTDRYYWVGDDLKYFKSTKDSEESLTKITKLTSEVDDKLFDIPEDYEEIEE